MRRTSTPRRGRRRSARRPGTATRLRRHLRAATAERRCRRARHRRRRDAEDSALEPRRSSRVAGSPFADDRDRQFHKSRVLGRASPAGGHPPVRGDRLTPRGGAEECTRYRGDGVGVVAARTAFSSARRRWSARNTSEAGSSSRTGVVHDRRPSCLQRADRPAVARQRPTGPMSWASSKRALAQRSRRSIGPGCGASRVPASSFPARIAWRIASGPQHAGITGLGVVMRQLTDRRGPPPPAGASSSR